jgi:tRNA pseudouridine55 synthase
VLDGLLVVDKPAGWTSHDVVAKLRGATRQRRIGHAGSLVPVASGVLLVGLGRATRLLRFLQETSKEYRGEIAFGVGTSTLDAAGEVVARAPMPVTESEVRVAMTRFVGAIEQVPPMVSALKVGGRRLHQLAREGREVERAPRPVTISAFELEAFVPEDFPRATVRVECSSGTYIRTLAADLGTALGGHAHLAGLRRLRVGAFTLADARPLDDVLVAPEATLLSPAAALRGMETHVVGDDTAALIATGRVLAAGAAPPVTGAGPFAFVDTTGTLLAVYERFGGRVKPAVVIPPVGTGE